MKVHTGTYKQSGDNPKMFQIDELPDLLYDMGLPLPIERRSSAISLK